MFCIHCGTQNRDEAQYCVKCGQPITGPTASAAPGSGPQPPLNTEPAEPKTSGKAIGSLICGFFAWTLPAAVAAIVLGHISRSEIRKSAGRLKGAGLAMTGLVFGYIGVSLIPILIGAAIIIPNLLRSRIAANEASAVGSIRTIVTAQTTYISKFPDKGYACNLMHLGGTGNTPQSAGLIDSNLSGGEKNGYRFFLRCDNNGYMVAARPSWPGSTGTRTFCSDETAVIRSAKSSAQNCFQGDPLQ